MENNLLNIVKIICLVIGLSIVIIDYAKIKKLYKLLLAILFFISIYLSTPFAIGIDKFFEIILVGSLILLIITIVYLFAKDKSVK